MQSSTELQRTGQATLVGSWEALSTLSSGAHVVDTGSSAIAVFPTWEPLNNAIVSRLTSNGAISAEAQRLARSYAAAGVPSWSLWVPSATPDLYAPDTVDAIEGMARDTTTLVMALELAAGMPSDVRVVGTTVEAAGLAGDSPIPADQIPVRNGNQAIDGWTVVTDGYAVAGAWTYRHADDVGVYAVGTAPRWRHRGIARALMCHLLADAYEHGARTASLQSTRTGEPLYRSLGFRPVGRYEEWVPDAIAHGDASHEG